MSVKEKQILTAIKSIPTKYKNTRQAEEVVKAIESVMGYNHYSHEDTEKVRKIIEGMTSKGYLSLIDRTSIFKINIK